MANQAIAPPTDHCRALLIEDDEAYGAVIGVSLRLAGCRVDQVPTLDAGFVALEHRSFDLLSILVSHPNRYLSAREILRLGWRAGDHGAEQLRTYVRRLRQKIDPMELPCRLLSEHGQGYCLAFD